VTSARANDRTDHEIATEIEREIERQLTLDSRRIRISVSGGVVRLRGSVDTVEQKWLAEEIVWQIPGTRDVVNELVVGSLSQAAGGAS
jgi:osmotically-inducible protein OsmY